VGAREKLQLDLGNCLTSSPGQFADQAGIRRYGEHQHTADNGRNAGARVDEKHHEADNGDVQRSR